MPAKDIYHNVVRTAIEKDGWTITNDPLKLTIGGRSVYVDLGAEKLIAAEKGNQKIAIEVKSFVGASPVNDLENAVGQYVVYGNILEDQEPQRRLYLAISRAIFIDIFSEPIGQLILKKTKLHLMVFEPKIEEIVEWIH